MNPAEEAEERDEVLLCRPGIDFHLLASPCLTNVRFFIADASSMMWVACLTWSAAIEWFTLCNVTVLAVGRPPPPLGGRWHGGLRGEHRAAGVFA